MDPLEIISNSVGGKIQRVRLLNANVGDTGTKRLSVKGYRGRKINVVEYQELFAIEVAVESALYCAVNRPDLIMGYRTPAPVPGFPVDVYCRQDEDGVPAGDADFWKALGAMLAAMFQSGTVDDQLRPVRRRALRRELRGPVA